MILYHVILFNKPTQEILIPRIPGDTAIEEEVKTNRICLAPSIIQCLCALEIYKYFQEDALYSTGISLLLYQYSCVSAASSTKPFKYNCSHEINCSSFSSTTIL